MKSPPLHLIASRIQRLSLAQQIHHLRALVNCEKPRSVRRIELESLLQDRVTRLLRKENRAA